MPLPDRDQRWNFDHLPPRERHEAVKRAKAAAAREEQRAIAQEAGRPSQRLRWDPPTPAAQPRAFEEWLREVDRKLERLESV